MLWSATTTSLTCRGRTPCQPAERDLRFGWRARISMAPAPHVDDDPLWGLVRSRRRGPLPGAQEGSAEVSGHHDGRMGRPTSAATVASSTGCPSQRVRCPRSRTGWRSSSMSRVIWNTRNQDAEPAASVRATAGLSRSSVAPPPDGPLAVCAKSRARRRRRGPPPRSADRELPPSRTAPGPHRATPIQILCRRGPRPPPQG
jgi:hypothetical protein